MNMLKGKEMKLIIGLILVTSLSVLADESTFENLNNIDNTEVDYRNSCSVPGYSDICRGESFYVSGCSVSCPSDSAAYCNQGNVWGGGAYCQVYHSDCGCI